MKYLTEREGDLPPRNRDMPAADFIQAAVAFLNGLAERGWLARGWPRRCSDDPHPIVGTDVEAFWDQSLRILNFDVRDPRRLQDEAQPLKILNLLEHVREHVAVPSNHDFHGYFTHWHLDFNGPQGKADFTRDVNDLFARFGLAFEMTTAGQVVRNPPEEIRQALLTAKFQTADNDLDELLESARTKYLNPDPAIRKEGLERLWDAFERLKTVEGGKDKKARIAALIEAAYADADARNRFDTEFRELTEIGNAYNIRHFERDKLAIPDDTFVDWLFVRCYSAISAVLEKTGRVRH